MKPYFTDEEDIQLLKQITGKILLNYNTDIPIQLDEIEAIFIERMRVIYDSDCDLLVLDWQNSFPNMSEDEARYTLDVFMNNHVE